jgi:hypothetical protein
MPQLSAKMKILMTILIPSALLGPVIILIAVLSLYITLRTAVIYLTLITLIYFIAKSASIIYK